METEERDSRELYCSSVEKKRLLATAAPRDCYLSEALLLHSGDKAKCLVNIYVNVDYGTLYYHHHRWIICHIRTQGPQHTLTEAWHSLCTHPHYSAPANLWGVRVRFPSWWKSAACRLSSCHRTEFLSSDVKAHFMPFSQQSSFFTFAAPTAEAQKPAWPLTAMKGNEAKRMTQYFLCILKNKLKIPYMIL